MQPPQPPQPPQLPQRASHVPNAPRSQPQMASQPPALAPGTLLAGRYFIQGYIGGGGFGHIYKAQDRVLGHRRAIKEAFFRDPQTQHQFRLEAEFVLNARHPHLVRGYAVFEQAGRFYLVMDYVDGQTVEEVAIQQIRRTSRPLSEAQVLDWMLPICDAVHALHNQPLPIIHRDVKPANIKLTRQGAPVLIDLGLAKLYNQGTQTIGAALAFTPGYAPPEQYQASGATDQRTDIYGLGATLYYLLTGYQPTEAPARLSAHALPTLRTLNPTLSAATEQVVLRALTLDPAGRQQDAAILLRELRMARQMLDALAVPVVATRTMQRSVADGATHLNLGATADIPALQRSAAPAVEVAVLDHSASSDGVLPGAHNEAAAQMRAAFDAIPQPIGRDSAHTNPIVNRAAPPEDMQPNAAPLVIPPAQAHRRIAPIATSAHVAGAHAARPRPPARAALISVIGTQFHQAQTMVQATASEEALNVIATMLAVICLSLSLMAIFSVWMLVFIPPAVLLSIWSWRFSNARTPLEFRNLALICGIVALCWPLIWFTVSLVAQRLS